MKYYSEVTKKFYESEQECSLAEEFVAKEKEEEELRKATLAKEKDDRKAEIIEAYEKLDEIRKEADKQIEEARKTARKLYQEYMHDYHEFRIEGKVPDSLTKDVFAASRIDLHDKWSKWF